MTEKVKIDEIIEALRHIGCASGLDVRHALANRIEAEGIAPPDGWVLVNVEDVHQKRPDRWHETKLQAVADKSYCKGWNDLYKDLFSAHLKEYQNEMD